MKRIYLLSILIAFSLISFAQISREQADEILLNYVMNNEDIRKDVLGISTTDVLPNAKGISTITIYASPGRYETFSVEYPCWVYFLYEWMDINCCRPFRYLFVDKATGSVMEIKKMGSPHEPSPKDWRPLYSAVTGLFEINRELEKTIYFSNLVDEILTITSKKDFEQIKIFDLQGQQMFQALFQPNNSIQTFDVSVLRQGIYVMQILGRDKNVLNFKIVKK